MSILGLICVLLALVATLLFVLFLFQRRDLRAVSDLSLSLQRAVSGERLPQNIEIDPGHETQLDVQTLGISDCHASSYLNNAATAADMASAFGLTIG